MTADDAAAPAPFWNVNVPAHLRTAECPDFLLGAGDKDRGILATPDARYRARAWAEVCAIVRANRLERFQRRPSDLRRYRAFVYFLVREYGGVADFVLRERLRWEAPVRPRGAQFQYPEDYKILFNDWPYGIDPRIVHLVIWTKFPLEEDSTTHDLTDRARKAIETFVSKTFYSSIARDHVIWFKNWKGLKSVHALEHFHVMLFDPDPAFVRKITNNDVPQYQKPDL